MRKTYLWKLERTRTFPDYDEARSFVVRAASAGAARYHAAHAAGDEGEKFWMDRSEATCERIDEQGTAGVVCRDFHNG